MIRTFSGNSISKKCTFSFISGDAVILQLLVILAATAPVKTPGEIFIADFCRFSVEEVPGAPGAS